MVTPLQRFVVAKLVYLEVNVGLGIDVESDKYRALSSQAAEGIVRQVMSTR